MIKRLTHFLVRIFIPNFQNTDNETVRARYGLLQGSLGTGVNLLLFAIKITLGLTINSLALIVDAFDSLSDMLTTIIVIISFKISKKPADEGHPYGHGRAEYIATLIISLLLIITGIEFFKSGLHRLSRPEVYDFHRWIIVAVFFTLIIKVILSQITGHLGNIISSDTLKADFWHHRTDAISSLFVIMALVLTPLGYPWIDAVAAQIVAGLVVLTGGKIAWGAIDTLLGKPPSGEYMKKLTEIVRGFPDVLDIHDIVVYSYGQKRFVSLHVEVSDKLSTMRSHALAEGIEKHLAKKIGAFSTIHIDPIQVDNETVNAVKKSLTTFMGGHEGFLGFHDVRVVDNQGCHSLLFEMVTKAGPGSEEAEGLKRKVTEHLRSRFSHLDPAISIAPAHIAQ